MASSYFKHDAMGRLAHWQLPDGNKLAYHYLHGELSGIDLNGAELTRHQMVGGLEMRRSQGTLTQQYEYDEQGRLTALRLQRGKQIAREWRYGYDRTGNLLQINDSVQGEQHYSYDPLDRLLEVRGELTERFLHDPAGNLLSQTQGAQFEPARTQGNRLLFSGDRHFEYDEFGRLAVERRGKGQSLVTRYEYDCQHQLIAVELPDGSTARYDYDAFGRRIRKTLNGQEGQGAELVTEFLWQANYLIAESRSDGIYRSFVYEPGSFKPLVQLEGEGDQAEVYHYQLDHLGTPLALTHHDGHTAWQVRYRAYGNVWKQELAEVETPLRFQGQYYDEETGLHYNRHRYYQPGTGRFITPDPVGLLGGLNCYRYGLNPLRWVDPLGLTGVDGVCPDTNSALKKPNNTANGVKPDDIPMTQNKYDEVINLERGNRPENPSSYLPDEYVSAHRKLFEDQGGAFFSFGDWWSKEYKSLPANKFIGLQSEMEDILNKASAISDKMDRMRYLDRALALGVGDDVHVLARLAKKDIYYIRIKPGDSRFQYNMPTGNEGGAYPNQWVPGGKTKGGTRESVLVGSENVHHGGSMEEMANLFGSWEKL